MIMKLVTKKRIEDINKSIKSKPQNSYIHYDDDDDDSYEVRIFGNLVVSLRSDEIWGCDGATIGVCDDDFIEDRSVDFNLIDDDELEFILKHR